MLSRRTSGLAAGVADRLVARSGGVLAGMETVAALSSVTPRWTGGPTDNALFIEKIVP